MELVEQTPEVETPVVETPQPPSDEPASLADHEKQFGAPQPESNDADEVAEVERNDKGRFVKAPHRAQSHRAGASDVEEIQAQTARLRQAEKDAGITAPDKKPGESDRAYNLRRQADIAEALRDARKVVPVTPQNGNGSHHQPAAVPIVAPNGYKPVPFDKPKPKAADFQSADDPGEAWVEAVTDWKFDKRIHDAQQQILAQRSTESTQAAIEQGQRTRDSLNAKIAEFEKTTPDYWARIGEVDVPELAMPDVLVEAIVSDLDNAPKLMYHLATHPDDLVEAIGFAAPFQGDVTQQTVGLIRRKLSRYLNTQALGAGATPTGAPASAAPVIVAPRPPTPVRTGPLKTGDGPPGDDSSLADHEKYYGPRRRR